MASRILLILVCVLWPGMAVGDLFVFTDTKAPGSEFVIKLTNPKLIDQANNILSGNEKKAIHVQGRIIKGKADYNKTWDFYLDPTSISFFRIGDVDVDESTCDATVTFVAENLDQVGGAFLPGNRWCPTTSRLVRKLMKQKQG